MADFAAEITPRMAAEAALTVLATACARDIDRHLAQMMETEASEGPHKTRVALRRLTTALDAFASLLRRNAAREIRREAKRIFRRLGEVRDIDVYLEALPARDRDRHHDEAETLRERTRQALRDRGALAFAPRLQSALAGSDLYRSGYSGLAARGQVVTDLARTALDTALRRCRAHGKSLTAMGTRERHEFRKDVKTLRYLTEFFAGLWPESQAEPALAALQDLQDDLGLLNDMANARRRAGKPLGRSRAEAEATARAEAHWAALRKARPWWRDAPLAELPPPAPPPPEPPEEGED